MPTYRLCPPGKARGTHKARVSAAYGMQPVMAAAMIGRKPCKIVPATWIYRSYRKDVLVKGGTR